MPTKRKSPVPTGPLLNERDAAAYIAMTMSYLRKARHVGVGPVFTRVGGRTIRYRLSDLDAWINAQRVQPEPAAALKVSA